MIVDSRRKNHRAERCQHSPGETFQQSSQGLSEAQNATMSVGEQCANVKSVQLECIIFKLLPWINYSLSIIFCMAMWNVPTGHSMFCDFDQFESVHWPIKIWTKKKEKKFYLVYNMLAVPETWWLSRVKMLHELNIEYLPAFSNT